VDLVGRAAFVGFLTGVVGTAIGGLIAAALGRPSRRLSSAMLGFSGGVMLAIVGMNLFPEAIRRGGLLVTSVGLGLGVGLIYAMDALLPHTHVNPHDPESRGYRAGRPPRGEAEEDQARERFARTAVLIGLGVALHNLPEGAAVGSGYASGTAFGTAVVALIFFQKIPEGIAVAAPYLIAGRSRLRAIGLTALAGLPQALGAFLGAAVASVSPVVLALALAFSGGAMLFIVGDELLPGAHELEGGHTPALGLAAGMLSGMVLTALLAGV